MLYDIVPLQQINRVLFKIWEFMKSLLGASFNKSILFSQSDIKKHFAFLYSLKFCQTFLLNTIFLFLEHVLSIADDILNSHKVIYVYLNGTSLFERKIYKK